MLVLTFWATGALAFTVHFDNTSKTWKASLACALLMQPGAYSYHFLVDGHWRTSANGIIQPDEQGQLCNQVCCACPLQDPVFMTVEQQLDILDLPCTAILCIV